MWALYTLASDGNISSYVPVSWYRYAERNLEFRGKGHYVLWCYREIYQAEISFYEPLNIDWDGNELLLSDILGTDDDIVYNLIEDEVDKELLFTAMKNLSNREKEIVELRFGLCGYKEKTQKEVADMLGISQSYISRLEKKIIKRLKKEINKMI